MSNKFTAEEVTAAYKRGAEDIFKIVIDALIAVQDDFTKLAPHKLKKVLEEYANSSSPE